MLAIEPEQRRQEVWAVRQPRRLLVDHFDLVALQYGDIHEFSGFVAAAVLDDQQTGRNHLKHEAKRRQVACGPPDKETLTIAPDTEVYAWAFHGGRKARERLRCERQPSFELQWPLHHIRRNEGERDARHVAFLAPDMVKWPLKFERRLPLAAQPLTRLAPAVERPGIHLGVWRDGEDLFVWGATRHLPAFCLVLEVIAPGLLVVKHSRGDESGKFVNIAVLQGDEIKMIDEQSARLPDCPDLLTSLLGFDSQHASSESVSVLIHLSVSMRAHGRGGSLLVVPSKTEQ